MARIVFDTRELPDLTDAELLATWQLLNQQFSREIADRLLGPGESADADETTGHEKIEKWRTAYAPAIDYIKVVWRSPVGDGDWTTANYPPSGNDIIAIMKASLFGRWTSKGTAMNIQKVIIADREARDERE